MNVNACVFTVVDDIFFCLFISEQWDGEHYPVCLLTRHLEPMLQAG